ncbi:phospholipase-like protein, partial [Tanacetum coccineum]
MLALGTKIGLLPRRLGTELDVIDTMVFQLGGVKKSMTMRQFILALRIKCSDFSLGLLMEFFDLWKLGSPLDTVVEGLMSNVLNKSSIYKFRVGYGVTVKYVLLRNHADVGFHYAGLKLIRTGDLGPFKHTIDDGLELRKAVFECVDTLLDNCLDQLNPSSFIVPYLKSGLDEMSKRMTGQDKEEEKDALIDILKIVVEECKSIYKKAQIKAPSSMTSKIPGISFETEKEKEDSSKTLPCQLPPNEMNPGSFTLSCTIGIGEEKVKFDMNGGICHFRVPVEIFYMESSVKECENFNLLKLKMMYSLMIPLRACYWSKKLKGSQDDEVGSHILENVVSRWHVCKPIHITFVDCEKDCGQWPTCNPDLSFCSGYDAIYGHEEIRYENKNIDDVTCKRTRDDPYSRRFDVHKQEFDNEIEQLENKYKLKAGRKRYALDEVWEKCKKFHDTTKLWFYVLRKWNSSELGDKELA